MTITLELSDEQSQLLQRRARDLGVDVRDLARAAVADLLAKSDEDFSRAADFVIEKNRELYRRLS